MYKWNVQKIFQVKLFYLKQTVVFVSFVSCLKSVSLQEYAVFNQSYLF